MTNSSEQEFCLRGSSPPSDADSEQATSLSTANSTGSFTAISLLHASGSNELGAGRRGNVASCLSFFCRRCLICKETLRHGLLFLGDRKEDLLAIKHLKIVAWHRISSRRPVPTQGTESAPETRISVPRKRSQNSSLPTLDLRQNATTSCNICVWLVFLPEKWARFSALEMCPTPDLLALSRALSPAPKFEVLARGKK